MMIVVLFNVSDGEHLRAVSGHRFYIVPSTTSMSISTRETSAQVIDVGLYSSTDREGEEGYDRYLGGV